MAKNKKIIYFDYAATTPIDPRVAKETNFYLKKFFGNTMSLHNIGQAAKEVLEKDRQKIADLVGAKSQEIIFTSSATESNNLVLKGVAFQNKKKGNHIIISSIEHDCILNSAEWLESEGFEITRLKVDKNGLVDPKEVKKAIKKETILVSVIHASNEIGTIEPIEEIGKICREKKNSQGIPYFHTDAAQTFGKIPIDVNKMNVDLLTASSHKIYGPKGAAFLFLKQGVKITPLLHGGGHEFGLRSSTVNLPAIAGFTKAAEICHAEMKEESIRLKKMRDKLIEGVLKNIPGSHLTGHLKNRLVNNASFWFQFVEGESIIMLLDSLAIAASTGSACSSNSLEPSHVLLALGLRPQEAHGSLRLSLGRWTTEKEIDYLLEKLPSVIENLRKISPFKRRKM